MSRGDNSNISEDGSQGASPSGKADPKSCGRELDDESISELVGFFRLLDNWDRERQDEKSKEPGRDS